MVVDTSLDTILLNACGPLPARMPVSISYSCALLLREHTQKYCIIDVNRDFFFTSQKSCFLFRSWKKKLSKQLTVTVCRRVLPVRGACSTVPPGKYWLYCLGEDLSALSPCLIPPDLFHAPLLQSQFAVSVCAAPVHIFPRT